MLEFSLDIPQLKETSGELAAAQKEIQAAKDNVIKACDALVAIAWSGAAKTQFETNYKAWGTDFDGFSADLELLRNALDHMEPTATAQDKAACGFSSVLGGAGGDVGASLLSLERGTADTVKSGCQTLDTTDYQNQISKLGTVSSYLSNLCYTSFPVGGDISAASATAKANQEMLGGLKSAVEAYQTAIDGLEETVSSAVSKVEAPEGYDETLTGTDMTLAMLGLMSTDALLAMDLSKLPEQYQDMVKLELAQRVGEDDGKKDVAIWEVLFPGLAHEIQELIDSGAVGAEAVLEKELEMTLPDGTTAKYKVGLTIKTAGADYVTISTSLGDQTMALKGTGWEIGSDGKIKIGEGVSITSSMEDLSAGVKVGQDVALDDYTTLHATEYQLKYDVLTGGVIMGVKTGADTETDHFKLETSLTVEKRTNGDNLPQLEPVPVVEAVPAPVETPWYEDAWNWVCDTASDVGEWCGDHTDELVFGGLCVVGAVITVAAVLEPTPAGEMAAASYWTWAAAH